MNEVINNPFDLNYVQEVCKNSTSQVLAKYFHNQKIFLDIDFAVFSKKQSKDDYCSQIIGLIAVSTMLCNKNLNKCWFKFLLPL